MKYLIVAFLVVASMPFEQRYPVLPPATIVPRATATPRNLPTPYAVPFPPKKPVKHQ